MAVVGHHDILMEVKFCADSFRGRSRIGGRTGFACKRRRRSRLEASMHGISDWPSTRIVNEDWIKVETTKAEVQKMIQRMIHSMIHSVQ